MKSILRAFLTTVATLAALAALAGCAERIRQPIPAANPEAALANPPAEIFPEPAPRTEGSLFSEDSVNLFADAKARRVGDIVTINIVENSRASKNANTTTGRANSLQANTNALLGYENPANAPIIGGVFNALNMRPNVGIDAGYTSSFSGSGTTARTESMNARLSASVIQVLPNGNLVLRGSQEILVNNERQYITIQGVVRPYDIGNDNTVLSTYIADARIDYTGQGDLSRKQREGWLSRFFDSVWPF
ncbi:MAG: flagellar basal body L-ring protein FlgH [Candidatus Adiutrix sp.]|jgi:flagellar L-ring protein precursor FlgH|nr:flagellar basal body L-ring protein FlgH [Candidatus Adiutrix sp.]